MLYAYVHSVTALKSPMSSAILSPQARTPHEVVTKSPQLPPIIRIVLTQATRFWMRGQISLARFKAQVQRLSREELATRGLALRTRESGCGGKLWIIEVAKSGKVLETIEVFADPSLEGQKN